MISTTSYHTDIITTAAPPLVAMRSLRPHSPACSSPSASKRPPQTGVRALQAEGLALNLRPRDEARLGRLLQLDGFPDCTTSRDGTDHITITGPPASLGGLLRKGLYDYRGSSYRIVEALPPVPESTVSDRIAVPIGHGSTPQDLADCVDILDMKHDIELVNEH